MALETDNNQNKWSVSGTEGIPVGVSAGGCRECIAVRRINCMGGKNIRVCGGLACCIPGVILRSNVGLSKWHRGWHTPRSGSGVRVWRKGESQDENERQ